MAVTLPKIPTDTRCLLWVLCYVCFQLIFIYLFRDCYPREYFGSFDGRFEICRRALAENLQQNANLTTQNYLTFHECMQLLNSEPVFAGLSTPRVSIAKVLHENVNKTNY